MKDANELAKYRIKGPKISKQGFDLLGIKSDFYRIPINGNHCTVSITKELGDIHVSASVILSENVQRIPNYAELLEIKDIFFDENETIVFGISKNILMNMTITNPSVLHMYIYTEQKPPIDKIIQIDHCKKDEDYKITKGKGWGWEFVKITGGHYPDMDELRRFKEKYMGQKDVAVFLINGAVILFHNPKNGITFHKMTMK